MNELRQMLEVEQIKHLKCQAKVRELEFANEKDSMQLKLKISSLIRLNGGSLLVKKESEGCNSSSGSMVAA